MQLPHSWVEQRSSALTRAQHGPGLQGQCALWCTLRMCSIHWTLQQPFWHRISHSVPRQSSSGFRDACEIISQSSARHRYYHLKTEQSRSTPALHRHFLGLTAASGTGPSPASRTSSTSVIFREQKQAFALSSFCLTFSYCINKLALITEKK